MPSHISQRQMAQRTSRRQPQQQQTKNKNIRNITTGPTCVTNSWMPPWNCPPCWRDLTWLTLLCRSSSLGIWLLGSSPSSMRILLLRLELIGMGSASTVLEDLETSTRPSTRNTNIISNNKPLYTKFFLMNAGFFFIAIYICVGCLVCFILISGKQKTFSKNSTFVLLHIT